MTARGKLQVVLDSGKVVAVAPAVLDVKNAAAYLGGISESKLNAWRASDARAVREGRALEGPRWVVIGSTMVRYRVADLDAWLRENARELAVVDAYRGVRGEPQ